MCEGDCNCKKLDTEIVFEIRRILNEMDIEHCLLSILGSYKDTLPDADVLDALECYEVEPINDCTNCEAETMLEYASLALRLETAKRYNNILEKCLDTKDLLCNFYREENEQLRTRIEFLEETKNETKS